jgi:2-haloacid dehalogenase
VLRAVVLAFVERFHFQASPDEIDSLHKSVPDWPPFPDTVRSLRELQRRYRLIVISNIDDDLFAATRKHLGVEFAGVITAEQARSYKPSLNNFRMALRSFSLSPDHLLHVGQSIYHDVVPAQALGISTVWVNRKSARPGVGAVRASAGKPDLEVPDLGSLVTVLKCAQG